MAYNERWPRWFVASIVKHFEDSRNDLHMFVEGGNNRETNKHTEYFELRIDGPYYSKTHGYDRLDFEINAVVNLTKSSNFYRIDELNGLVAVIFTEVIHAYRYGDDNSFIGCLKLKQEFKEKLLIKKLGQVDPSTKLERAIVEGHYYIEL